MTESETHGRILQQQPLSILNVQQTQLSQNLRSAQATQPHPRFSTLIRSCRPSIDLASLSNLNRTITTIANVLSQALRPGMTPSLLELEEKIARADFF